MDIVFYHDGFAEHPHLLTVFADHSEHVVLRWHAVTYAGVNQQHSVHPDWHTAATATGHTWAVVAQELKAFAASGGRNEKTAMQQKARNMSRKLYLAVNEWTRG